LSNSVLDLSGRPKLTKVLALIYENIAYSSW
jgi:hypothetical protein